MAIVVRLFVMVFAYLLGCLAAAVVLLLGTFGPQWDQVAFGLSPAALWALVGVGAVVIAAIALLPSLLVIALAEAFAFRSVVIYGAVGGILALALWYGIDFARYLGGPDNGLARPREVLAASGIAGGLVYWAFAGRKAGSWKGQ
jgi:hypothetical protein